MLQRFDADDNEGKVIHWYSLLFRLLWLASDLAARNPAL